MVEFLKRFRLLWAVLFLFFTAFLILVVHAREDRSTPFVEKVLSQISFPLQDRAHKAVRWLKGLGENYIFLTRVQEDNQRLQRTLSALREENNRLKELLLAEKRLEKLQIFQAQYSSSIVAQVFARDPSSWFKTILVDKGEQDGVTKDMAVITADGVVGRVIEISPNVAKVLILTDPNSALDVLIQRSRCQGIMEGKMENICILKYVQKSDDVQVGDKVITSGLGGIFPKGLVTGTVTAVDRKRPGIFQHIEVTPAVDFSRLEEVLLIEGEP
jgi:rod shape-determining protein MreC